MLVKFLVLFLIFYCPAVYANETATRCIGAIKAFEQSDRNEDLKKAFTKILLGKYGFARMLKGGESLPAPASVSASNEGHIRYCTKYELKKFSQAIYCNTHALDGFMIAFANLKFLAFLFSTRDFNISL